METFSALLALCAGNSPVTGEFPSQRPVTRSFDVFYDLCFNKRFNKQSWGWWFEMPSSSLWRHCNDCSKHCRQGMVIGFSWSLMEQSGSMEVVGSVVPLMHGNEGTRTRPETIIWLSLQLREQKYWGHITLLCNKINIDKTQETITHIHLPHLIQIRGLFNSWWRHQMETFSTLLALCEGNPPIIGGFPPQRPVMQSFDVLFDPRLNKSWTIKIPVI